MSNQIFENEMDENLTICNEPQPNQVTIFKTQSLPYQQTTQTFVNELPKTSKTYPQIPTINKIDSETLDFPLKGPYDVMVCDDDPFQHLYYESFFEKKTLSSSDLSINPQKIKLDLSYSGTELLMRFTETSRASVRHPKIVITDLDMGSDQISGIDTAQKLRAAGYKGTIIMRSSEPESSFMSLYSDLIKNGVIDFYSEKSNFAGFKEIMNKFFS